MTKTEKAIALIKEDPFQSAQEIAKEAGLSSTSSLNTILNQQGINLGEVRQEAIRQLKKEAGDNFKYNWEGII